MTDNIIQCPIPPNEARRLQALRSYDGTTFWGPTRWDDTGQNVAGQTVTFQIQKGEIRTVFPKAAAQAAPIYPAN